MNQVLVRVIAATLLLVFGAVLLPLWLIGYSLQVASGRASIWSRYKL